MFYFHKVAYVQYLGEVDIFSYMSKTFLPFHNIAKIIKIDRDFPKLWSQMYCHLFMVHSVVWFAVAVIVVIVNSKPTWTKYFIDLIEYNTKLLSHGRFVVVIDRNRGRREGEAKSHIQNRGWSPHSTRLLILSFFRTDILLCCHVSQE